MNLKQNVFRIFILAGFALIIYCAYLFFSFHPRDFSQNVSQDSNYYDPFASRYSKSVVDRNGALLSVFLNDKEQWHLNDTEQIPNKLKIAVITFEDKHFYSHFGIDFFAIFRTIRDNFSRSKRAGASTLSMQVVKLLLENPRTYANKFKESIYALRLESLYHKDSILQMYLNNAPYGGNIVGFKSASLLYFQKLPKDLTWAESCLLAVLPNAPGLINLKKNQNLLEKKRNALLQRLYELNHIDSTILNISLKEPIPDSIIYHKNIAPHLSLRLINEDKKNKITLKASVDKAIQKRLEYRAKEYAMDLQRQDILNLSALLLDSKNGEVIAYLGSQDFLDIENFGQIDGVRSFRSPGSLLKPLLYALSIDDGLISPQSMLVDVPLFFANFNPQNASHSYFGLVSAKDSLIKSLNVPFVNLLQEYGAAKFFFNLKEIVGFKDNDPHIYGLSLILGTKEMSVENIAKIYLMLANFGEIKKICYALPCGDFAGLDSIEIMESKLQDSKVDSIESKNANLTRHVERSETSNKDNIESKLQDSKVVSIESNSQNFIESNLSPTHHPIKKTDSIESNLQDSKVDVSHSLNMTNNQDSIESKNIESSSQDSNLSPTHYPTKKIDSMESNRHPTNKTKKILSAGASFLTLESLKELKREGIENLHKDKKIIAWKSGTSYGRKDAWAAGVTPLYTLIVWAGNFTGKGNSDLLGANTAGSLLFALLGELDSIDLDFKNPGDLKEVKIDTFSGYAIDADLSEYDIPSSVTFLPIESKPLKPSPFLKKVWLDSKGKQIDSNNPNFINAQPSVKYELPLSVLNYYKLQNVNIYSHIKDSQNDRVLKIIYPTNDLKIIQANDLNKEQNVIARIANLKRQKVFWYLDGEFLGENILDSRTLNLGLGSHTLIIIGEDGSKDSITFYVEK
ncbi:penicillin-binding protein 1C [Helicobacter saguini]|uniref:peptidoglycan glycosyltransferase n=1 Tax=Helicobacter saguini TaxID=1548018 RepID=A0A6B0HNA2_9HELI|nr:penicillin-binding protein 1C [Helicobacter saguini]MWV61350.1 penicillin-binding protein 1C [Helicobacter saguini]MWV67980.1 penicillin-binding protein 1C [Helicobacter saguini]MWV70552.1 penicillin-binding protein 1C [Helicobacter saguini]MWV72456.1 penicillin-binding protein 1C [Helicobacter saguini]